MKQLNDQINKEVGDTFKYWFSLFKREGNTILEWYSGHNSVLLVSGIVLLFFGTQVVIMRRKEFKIDWSKDIEFITHIIMASVLGCLVKAAGITKILDVLSAYWKLSLIILILTFFVFVKDILIYRKSFKKVSIKFFQFNYFLGLTYLFSAVATRNLDLVNYLILVIVLIGLWLARYFLECSVEKQIKDANSQVSEESDTEITELDQLLPTRKDEFLRIRDYLDKLNHDEPFAITINADWGEGKTSFINVLTKKFEDEGSYIITVQPMILDKTEKLMEYFFSQLESLLNRNNVYTGTGSAFKQYFELIMKFVSFKPILSLVNIFNVYENEQKKVDFRENKKLLENDIQKLLSKSGKESQKTKNQKIFVIIDDFDRVEEETIYNTLVFIKEIVNFRGINVLFLMDYRNLKSEKVSKKYLDKFVSKRFDLSRVTYDEIFGYFMRNLDDEYQTDIINNEMDNLKKNIYSYLNLIHQNFKNAIKEQEKALDKRNEELTKLENNDALIKQVERIKSDIERIKNDIELLKQKLNDYEVSIGNMRKAKKIIREMKEILIYCDIKYNNRNLNYLVDNLQCINMGELVFKLAILKVVFEEYYYDILKEGDIEEYCKISKSSFLKVLLEEFDGFAFNETHEVIQRHKKEFYNSIIFTREFSGNFYETMRTKSKELLDELDNQTSLNIQENFIGNIKEYLSVIRNDWEAPKYLTNQRVTKIVEFIFDLKEKELIRLGDMFQLLEESERNALLKNIVYFDKMNHYLQTSNIEFNEPNEKKSSLSYIKHVEPSLFSKYRLDIIMLVRLLKIKDPKYSYDSILGELGKELSLKAMNESLENLFKVGEINRKDLSDLDYFEAWSKEVIIKIKQENQYNSYISKSIEEIDLRIQEFICFYKLWRDVKKKVEDIKVNKHNAIMAMTATTITELIKEIAELHRLIFNENVAPPKMKQYFSTLIAAVERNTRIDKTSINSVTLKQIQELYNHLFENFGGGTPEDETLLLSATVTMGEIEERMKNK